MMLCVPALRGTNLLLKFLLELGAFAAFAYWGARAAGGVLSVVLAVATPALAVGLWSVFAAPKSERRLGRGARVPVELGVFALSLVALVAAGKPVRAAIFEVLAGLNAALLMA